MAASANLEKTYFNLTAAYAMRARAHLFHTDYNECAEDCRKALELAEAEGLRPYSINELAAPRFNDINDPSYILASTMIPPAVPLVRLLHSPRL